MKLKPNQARLLKRYTIVSDVIVHAIHGNVLKGLW